MGIEAGALKEEEKKKKKLTEADKQKQVKKVVEQNKKRAKVTAKEETDDQLVNLKDLVEKGFISETVAKRIVEGERLGEEGIKEIFDKIDEIENMKDVDKYLPKELRITREDYKSAVADDKARGEVFNKLEKSLTVLAQHVSTDSVGSVNLFTGFLSLLDKNLIKIQENTIDIKDTLEEIDEKKNPKAKKSLGEQIVEFFKDLLK